MSTEFLNGLDVRAYTIQGNGWDLYPGIVGSAYQMLGQYKELELALTITDSDNTPSSQYLAQSRMTGYDWEITAKHMVPVIDALPPGLDLFFSGNFNMLLVFQFWTGGPFISAYGRMKTDTVSITRESIMESLTIKNAGPVGTSGASLFAQDGTPYTSATGVILASNYLASPAGVINNRLF